VKMRDYFGAEKLVPLYVEVEDGERLLRALTRERAQKKPNYAELCRRFLADSVDFSAERLKAAGICRWFENTEKNATCKELVSYIKADIEQ